MTERDLDELDRQIDEVRRARGGDGTGGPLRQVPPGAGAADDDLLLQLSELTAIEWPARELGDRVLEGVAATLRPGPGPADWPMPGSARPQRSRRRSRPGRGEWWGQPRWRWAAAAATAAVAVAVAGTVLAGHWAAAQPFRSRFAATALPGVSVRVSGHANTWQLTGYLVASGWQAHAFSDPPGNLTCPAAGTCYLTAALTTSIHQQPDRLSVLAVSRDGGATWHALGLPGGVSFESALQCPVSPGVCIAAGDDAGRAVLLRTRDYGQSWSATRIPHAVYSDQLACSSGTACTGVFEVAQAAPRETFAVLVTADGGRSWTTGPPAPAGQSPDSVACRGRTCVLIDQPVSAHATSWSAWFSHDSGQGWQEASHPQAAWPTMTNQLPLPGGASCADSQHCWEAVTTTRDSTTHGALLATTDGGASWRIEHLPPPDQARSSIEAVSCPTAGQCWAAGYYATGPSRTSPVLFTTSDGGLVWSRVTLPPAASAAGVLPELGLISCATAHSCVALPDANPDAHRIPIYSLRG